MQVATHPRLYDELQQGLITAYKDITVSENGEAYVGMSIERSETDLRVFKLSQEGLEQKLIDKYPRHANDRARYHSPADDDLFEVESAEERENPQSEDSKELNAEEKSEFLSVLMTLMYLARLTRPDILMVVVFLASRTHLATKKDAKRLMKVIRYIEGTRGVGVHINCDSLQLHCSCDASYAVHTPPRQTKGHTGFVMGFGPNMSYLHGRSGKQKTPSTSSSDAEIIALCEATKMCLWMRELIRELRITPLQPIVMLQDNKSVIMMSTEKTLMKNSKHLLPKLTYVQHQVTVGAVKIEYCPTGDMSADVMSKPLHGEPFYKHIRQMVGLQWSDHFSSSATIHAKLKNVPVPDSVTESEDTQS